MPFAYFYSPLLIVIIHSQYFAVFIGPNPPRLNLHNHSAGVDQVWKMRAMYHRILANRACIVILISCLTIFLRKTSCWGNTRRINFLLQSITNSWCIHVRYVLRINVVLLARGQCLKVSSRLMRFRTHFDVFRPSFHTHTLSVFDLKGSWKWIKTKTHTYRIRVDCRKRRKMKTMTKNIAGACVWGMPIECNLRYQVQFHRFGKF